MTVAIIILVVCMVSWAFIMGCCEIERREERWRNAHPPDPVRKGGDDDDD